MENEKAERWAGWGETGEMQMVPDNEDQQSHGNEVSIRNNREVDVKHL